MVNCEIVVTATHTRPWSVNYGEAHASVRSGDSLATRDPANSNCGG